MQTKLSPEFKDSARGRAAEAILRSCVHCGFCNATCPTYQVLGDELDGPRGRIYLIKQMLEGGPVGTSTQLHLDRCLTCLSCETTCPSGVEYGRLVAIGREIVEERVPRPAPRRLQRWLLREGLTSALFGPVLALARLAGRAVPDKWRKFVPDASASRGGAWPQRRHARKVLLLGGCVQPALLPNINAATARVLDAAGIETVVAAGAGCCGALREHLADREGSLDDARRNIDAWWPLVADGTVEAIVSNASACGLAIKHYEDALVDDPDYGAKAARISAMARDVSELLPDLVSALAGRLRAAGAGRIAFHAPCTLQHGQRLRGGIDGQLAELGFEVGAAPAESHLCCGSAGTYSVLQPELSRILRDRKLANLMAGSPQRIASANVGCIQHLQSGSAIPVRHWIEIVDDALSAAGAGSPSR
jgi:glycolate oxidase iron-sulfur subunit